MREEEEQTLERLKGHRRALVGSSRGFECAVNGRERTMNDQGIGASVRRKEDFRFLTGAGNYTDDINRPGQLYAYILRSPSARW